MKKTVAYFNHQKSGCFWYRIKKPMDALAAAGVPTQMINLGEDLDYNDIVSFQVYGIYPFSFDKVLKTLKADGKRIIYDLDDALDDIEKTNPFYYNVRKDAGSELEIFQYADHITVATPKLAEYARKKTTAPITVIPNCYNPEEWTFPRPKREGVRIGFAGSCTHIEDLLLVLPAIVSLQKKYPNLIKFLIFGFGNDSYEEWLKAFKFSSPPEGLESLRKFEEFMEVIDFEWVPYVDFDFYPQTLINMSLDIGLCPVLDTSFNQARSASKAMEYTLAGALSLATDIETYRREPTSSLVKDKEWESALEAFIRFPEARELKYKEHLQWLKDNKNINTQVDVLKQIYVP